jgi:hypothetical protein
MNINELKSGDRIIFNYEETYHIDKVTEDTVTFTNIYGSVCYMPKTTFADIFATSQKQAN